MNARKFSPPPPEIPGQGQHWIELHVVQDFFGNFFSRMRERDVTMNFDAKKTKLEWKRKKVENKNE